MKKLVIFDLDGTLVNTIEDLGQAANHALQLNGFPTHSMAAYPFFVGNGVRRLMTRTLPEEHRTDAVLERVLNDFKAFYDEHLTDYSKPYLGVSDLLASLQDRGVMLAVASNKYQSAVERIIEIMFPEIDFVAVEGQKEGVNVKPDPSVVFAILSKAQVSKADTLYVGDSGVDMETAYRACVDSVGVTWGFRPEKELRDYNAGAIVSNPADILSIVERGLALS